MHIFTAKPTAHRPGILFAEDFDDTPMPMSRSGQGGAEPEPAVKVPTFTAEDVADARREGFNAGQHAARDEATQRLQDAARQSCERVVELAQRAEAMREAQLGEATEAAARLIFAALLTALPSLSVQHASSEIVHLVRNTLTGLAPEHMLTIAVAPESLPPLREALNATARDLARRVALAEDDSLAASDARLFWAGGSATRTAKLAHDGLGEILTSLGLLPTAPASPPPPSHAFVATSAPHSLETSHG